MKIGDPRIAIFTFLGGSGGPPGVPLGAKIEKCSISSLDGMLGVFLHRFWVLISTAGSKP